MASGYACIIVNFIGPMMRTVIYCAVLLSALAACSKQQPVAQPAPPAAPPVEAPVAAPVVEAPVPAALVLSPERYGPVKFGAYLRELEEELGAKSEELGARDPACHMVRFASLPGVRFMVENGVVTRADVGRGVANSLGIEVGQTLAEATRRHPALVVGPHKYQPKGHYLTMNGADGRTAIVMEEDGKAITKIRAGLLPSVSYVETCL